MKVKTKMIMNITINGLWCAQRLRYQEYSGLSGEWDFISTNPQQDWFVILVERLSTCCSHDDRHEWTDMNDIQRSEGAKSGICHYVDVLRRTTSALHEEDRHRARCKGKA